MASTRDLRLDTIRGVMLLIMAVNHLPWAKTPITGEPFGFVSAAEGFVFLSGLVCAMAYGRSFLQKGFDEAKRKIHQRARKIYLYHFTALLGVIGLAFLFSVQTWVPFLSPIESEPWMAAILGAFLLYQPAFFDILPLYCILLFITPWLLLHFNKGRGLLIVLSSFVLWSFAQMGMYQALVTKLALLLPVRMGIFDYFSWQFLFVLGAYLGFQNLHGQPVTSRIGPLWYVCLGLALLFLMLRHYPAGANLHSEFLTHLFAISEKNLLRPLRLLNFLVLAYLVAVAAKTWPKAFIAEPLAWLGQKSLELFTFHIFLIYFVFAWKYAFQSSLLLQVFTASALVAMLLYLARILQNGTNPLFRWSYSMIKYK